MNKAMMMVWWVLEVQARTHGVETVLVSFLLCNPKEPRRWLNDGLWDVGSAGGWICEVAQRPSHLPKQHTSHQVQPARVCSIHLCLPPHSQLDCGGRSRQLGGLQANVRCRHPLDCCTSK